MSDWVAIHTALVAHTENTKGKGRRSGHRTKAVKLVHDLCLLGQAICLHHLRFPGRAMGLARSTVRRVSDPPVESDPAAQRYRYEPYGPLLEHEIQGKDPTVHHGIDENGEPGMNCFLLGITEDQQQVYMDGGSLSVAIKDCKGGLYVRPWRKRDYPNSTVKVPCIDCTGMAMWFNSAKFKEMSREKHQSGFQSS
jgi:hypothetical protein